MFPAENLRRLVAPLNHKDGNPGGAQAVGVEHGLLKKAKGIKSLNLELSWMFVLFPLFS
jgi:hypothetical protein